MSDLRELYQQVIIDHSRQPRNFGRLIDATHQQQGFNPLCGDKITLYLSVQNDTIKDIQFEGCGCAISLATASLMTEALKGKPIHAVEPLFTAFRDVVTGKEAADPNKLGKLNALTGVAEYPMRVKCATLAWHTLMAALQDETIDSITTER